MSKRREWSGLDGLLDLHRQTFEVGDQYWVTIRATRVPKSRHRPHGVEYSLTLHRPGGKRILGYDNAHRPTIRGNPSGRSKRPVEHDHVHHGDKMTAYVFETPAKLLEDFWIDVEATLKQEGAR